MATPFTRTLRALRADRSRFQVLAPLCGLVFLLAWLGWFTGARVATYVDAEEARLEVTAGAHRLEAPEDGRVTEALVELGQRVEAGEVLLELDAEEPRQEGRVEQRRREALRLEREALLRQRTAAERRLEEVAARKETRLSETRAELERLESEARLAAAEEDRASKLAAAGLLSSSELEQRQAAARQSRAAVRAQRESVARIQADHRVERQEIQGEIAEIEGRLELLEGRIEESRGRQDRLRREADILRVRAPVAGRIGELATRLPGAVLAQGDFIATVIPRGRLAAVARFRPEQAVGRIRVGQRAWVRPLEPPTLRRFPATVTRVGAEKREGWLRVELDLENPPESELEDLPPSGRTWEHGLPVRVEVEVERVAPVALVLRAIGREVLGRGRPAREGGAAAE